MSSPQNNGHTLDSRPGIILLVTLVLLVVLATLGYTFSSRVAAQRHRNEYLMDYTRAQYGCDSAIKYALATAQDLEPNLVDRPNEPDFSDLYALDEAGYQELLAQWDMNSPTAGSDANNVRSRKRDINNVNDVNDINDVGRKRGRVTDPNNPDALVVRGPYGPPWPYVTRPVEFEIGPTKVRIEIEDENAKYPLGWALLKGKDVQEEADAGFVNFCELMRLDATQIDTLQQQLKQIGDMRPFLMDFKPTTEIVRTPVSTPTPAKGGIKRTPRTTVQRKVVPVSEQIAQQTAYFGKLFHSSLIETETLAKPTIVCENRKESALKYMDLWGTQKVNINTAPRPVLEAAFIFGGNEVQIADQVIQLRRQKPITSVQELKTALPRFADSIGKCEKYITTASTVFTVRITAISGVAKASSVIAITKEGDKVTTIGVIKG